MNQTMDQLRSAIESLTAQQKILVAKLVNSFQLPHVFWRWGESDIVSDVVLQNLGDRIVGHHATSRQSLSKDRFEFALEAALTDAGVPAVLVTSRTNRGHDISIRGVPVSLKTEAAKNIRRDFIHVSKWMELGRGEWHLPTLRDLFLEHIGQYDRVFTLRCLSNSISEVEYELVEIPKHLMLRAQGCRFEICVDSTQVPQPGYGYVDDANGSPAFSLYFDGGTERKLQIKSLRKDLCRVHATWKIALA